MARVHARVRGKSGSKRPVTADLGFVKFKSNEVVDLVVKLAKEDVKPTMIGLVLRDTYGIPSVKKITGKSVSKILEEEGFGGKIPEDLVSLVVRIGLLKKHLKNNPRDLHNKRGLLLMESRIRRLSKYYIREGKIPEGWSY